MKLLVVLFCTVTYHYCNGYPVIEGESTEEVKNGDDTVLEYMLDTRNDTYLKDYLDQLFNKDQEIESLVNEPRQQLDLETNEIPNLETNEIPNLETNEIPNLETNEIPNLETNEIPNLETNEIPNLDSELGNINDNDVVVVHIKYDVDSGTISVDSIEVEDAPEVAAWGRWPWFFLALAVALLMKLVWYLCRKEQQYKRDNEWRIQLVSEK